MVSRKKQELELLNRLGFLGHFYGVETMNAATAKAIGKGMDPERLQNGLIEAKDYFLKHGDFRASMGIVIGLPHETIESQQRTIQWLINNWQGECVHVWPLEIPVDIKTDVLSAISKDYTKYGYRLSDKPLPGSLDDDELKELGGNATRIKHGISNINWENDNMSLADACEISNNFYTRAHKKEFHFGTSMFTLGDYMIYGEKTREEARKVSMLDVAPTTDRHDRFYIENKLKWQR